MWRKPRKENLCHIQLRPSIHSTLSPVKRNRTEKYTDPARNSTTTSGNGKLKGFGCEMEGERGFVGRFQYRLPATPAESAGVWFTSYLRGFLPFAQAYKTRATGEHRSYRDRSRVARRLLADCSRLKPERPASTVTRLNPSVRDKNAPDSRSFSEVSYVPVQDGKQDTLPRAVGVDRTTIPWCSSPASTVRVFAAAALFPAPPALSCVD